MLSKSAIKYIQNLSRKKFRDEEKCFIAEGPKITEELLAEIPANLTALYATDQWAASHSGLLKNIAAEKLVIVSDDELERISSLKTSHDVVAVFKQLDEPATFDAAGKITLVLEGIQDPGNLGTIIRVADWFGIDQLLCSENCADRYNPKVVQSTMASIARVKTGYTNLIEWLRKNSDVKIYAAVMDGKNLFELPAIQEGIIIIGNESKGIGEEIRQIVHEKITIPGKGRAESLNAAMAAGIVLSHLLR